MRTAASDKEQASSQRFRSAWDAIRKPASAAGIYLEMAVFAAALGFLPEARSELANLVGKCSYIVSSVCFLECGHEIAKTLMKIPMRSKSQPKISSAWDAVGKEIFSVVKEVALGCAFVLASLKMEAMNPGSMGALVPWVGVAWALDSAWRANKIRRFLKLVPAPENRP